MSQSVPHPSSYGRERRCPHCGTRLAQRARTCFFCGASLESAARSRPALPWADFVLFAVIGALLVFWWVRAPSAQDALQLAAVSSRVGDGGPQPGLLPATQASPTRQAPTATSSPTATLPPTGTPLPTPIRHKVAPGDSIELIAGLYGASAKDIIEANGLSPDGFIRAGQELLVPVAGAVGGPGPTPTPAGGTLVYSVQSGDTIGSIAIRFGSEIDWIFAANGLQPGDLLHVGQSLLVPLTQSTPSPTVVPSAQPSTMPTEGPPFRAPILLTPADGAVLAGADAVLLGWASVGVLGKDRWYVVTVKGVGGNTSIAPYWTKATSWRWQPEDRGSSEFTWQIQVLSGTPGNPGQPLSVASEPRHFTWR
jgi:LysM repeat protein